MQQFVLQTQSVAEFLSMTTLSLSQLSRLHSPFFFKYTVIFVYKVFSRYVKEHKTTERAIYAFPLTT